MSVNLDAVERTMQALAEHSPLPFAYQDPATGRRITLSPETLASTSGYLPAIVSAAEAVWHEATGRGFQLDLARDPDALLGFRLRGIGSAGFTAVMLSAMEAMHQVTGLEAIVVSDLSFVWQAASERISQSEPIMATPSQDARP